jgi:hypothetical protein
VSKLRRLGLVAALLACFGLGAPPAQAIDAALVFTGTTHTNCEGCGSSSGTAWICVTGPIGPDVRNLCLYGTYTMQADPGLSCVVTDSADGILTETAIGLRVTFHWLRVGSLIVITTGGDITGAAVAAYAVTSPALPSIPCGGPVDAEIAGALTGV